ncbi:MAG: ATP-binding protein [Chloroflexota bacterium]|nr:ATP-binding protein [Chloroflexota bacterium]
MKRQWILVGLVLITLGTIVAIAAGRGIAMTTVIRDSVVLDLDAGRIRQVLDNLVTNAVRYTPEGGTITLELTAVADGAEVVVRDTGRGMTPDDAAQMFERFVKSADSGGSGLGLAMAPA